MNQTDRHQIHHERLAQMVTPLLQWYDSHARILPWRENPEPYAVWISEIMLQQTRVEAVKPYFDRWMQALPDLASLASASDEEVMKLWEGLGYYSRVRNIHKTAKLVMEQYNGRIPSSYEELRRLPGIGEYTAGSVGSIAFQLPVPCVDGNVLRVVARLTAESSDIGTAAAKKLITGWVSGIIPMDRPGDFNQAMMELGATVCLPNGQPKCEVCPVAFLCEASIQNRIGEFPVKAGKPERKIEKRTVLLLIRESDEASGAAPEAALRKRPETGLLAGLWEFPNFEGDLSENEALSILHLYGLNGGSLIKLKKAKHIFSHIEWHMTGYLAAVKETAGRSDRDKPADDDTSPASSELQWFSHDKMDARLALPAAFKAYYQILKRYISVKSYNE